ncbi:unnamed protein product [Trichogramma brassicae]|uniref:Uncharacterized protein n=1 Tax=Trichogramma brassicae TaxID=86971 RepID=A0A6H5IU77_9HYME|nr:unnamed protein product [Trichogramma brassicae]
MGHTRTTLCYSIARQSKNAGVEQRPLRKLVESMIFVTFDYGSSVFYDLNKEQSLQLHRLHNPCVRFVYGMIPHRAHVTAYRLALSWLSAQRRRDYNIIVLAFNIISLQSPKPLSSLFTFRANRLLHRAARRKPPRELTHKAARTLADSQTVSAKAAGVIGALTKILPNSGGPRSSRRGGSPPTSLPAYDRWPAARLLRGDIRPCRHTSAGPPRGRANAAPRLPPGGRKGRRTLGNAKQVARSICQSTKARWAHRLIPNIRMCIERRHGELNYHLTQLLTGHGFFKHHSRRYDHNHSSYSSIENAEYEFYHFPSFDEERDYRLFSTSRSGLMWLYLKAK